MMKVELVVGEGILLTKMRRVHQVEGEKDVQRIKDDGRRFRFASGSNHAYARRIMPEQQNE